MHRRIFISIVALLCCIALGAQSYRIDIDLKAQAKPVPGTLYGIFFEDINFGADGGLYAELVKNRSFEFPADPLQGWKAFGKVEIRDDGPFARCPHYARLSDPGHPHRWTGLDNEGFFGIGVVKGSRYVFSVWARVPGGGSSRIRIDLANTASSGDKHYLCHDTLTVTGAEWKRYELSISPRETCEKAILRIFLIGERVTTDLEHISLFPEDTWKGRPGGLRKDLAQALYDLHPGVFRFPGGCIVEGTDLEARYQWKNTVGPVENRPTIENRWKHTFTNRFYPDYFQSNGLGFFEYFQLAEDIGAEPLPILNCGLACQYQNDSPDAHCPVDSLDSYIQDALDLVEFANGPVSSTWGALRAEMGHPEPFGLKYLGVGNEQWDKLYTERLEKFVAVLRKACPEIRIVGSSGPAPEGSRFDWLWPEMRRIGVDLVDEHYYRPAEWFLAQGKRYDSYDRRGPKVFAGEYACHPKGIKGNCFYAALMEAALLTGIERNCDVVGMATYAPLFAHAEGWQWRPDLIWFDNLRVMRTASWHVQQLYGQYKGEKSLRTTMSGECVAGSEGQGGIFANAVSQGRRIYVKVANTSPEDRSISLAFSGLKKKESLAASGGVALTAPALEAENSLDWPDLIIPVPFGFSGEGKSFEACVPAYSFSIFILDIQ